MGVPEIKKYCQISLAAKDILRDYVNSGKLSARGFHRVLKLSRTIADLDESAKIVTKHVNEALMYRLKQK